MPPQPLSAESLWSLPRVGTPVPDPEGRRLVVPVTTYSMETNEGTTRLWLVEAPAEPGGAPIPPRPLTAPDRSSSAPAWSPDGRQIAFLRKPGGAAGDGKKKAGPRFPDKPQVYRMPADGGEPERLTDLPLGAAAPQWFPDGRLGFVAPLFREALTLDGTAELAKAREEEPVKARVTEDRVYRYWDRWLTDGQVGHIFVLDPTTGELRDLMPSVDRWLGLWEPGGAWRIAPDGREIAFSACRSEPPHSPILFGVYTLAVPAAGAQEPAPDPVLIHPEHPGPASRPVYSPDGRWLVYGIQREIDFYGDPARLVAYDRGAGTHTLLTEIDPWDRSPGGWTFGGDGDTLFLNAEAEGRNALFVLDLPAALADRAASPPREIAREGWIGEPQVAGGRIFATLESVTRPPEVAMAGLDGSGLARITDFTGPALAEIALGAVEEIHFAGADGDPVQMFLVHPGAADGSGAAPASDGPPPLVHMIHGGPHGAFGDQWHWRWNPHAFAAPGYRVAMVNFHGSTGWGDAFTRSILGRWGDQPYRDIEAATDLLIARGLVDPERMAITGGSYGGYLVSWICGQTERYACAINHAGVCDFQTQFASDITQGRRRSMGGELWDDLEGLDRYNPIRRAGAFRTPMLVIHGVQDYRVPYNQGLAIYNAYQAQALPARLVVYPDENHWILKPRNSRHWYGEVLGWLARWLGKAEG